MAWEVNELQMRGYIDIKGYGESDLTSEIIVQQRDFINLDTSFEIRNKHAYEELDTGITVVQRGRVELDSSIMISPNLLMRGYIDIIEAPKKVLKIYPNKDSTVRESAPILNYGSSPQMIAGEEVSGKLISYLGFDIELPSNFDELISAKLVLNKEYLTNKLFFMGIHEVDDNWLEDFITWDYRPKTETYVNQFVVPLERGEIKADITDFVEGWGEGKKSITLHPRNYSISDLTVFSTKESNNPPYIEITYYEGILNANAMNIDSEIVVARHVDRELPSELILVSDFYEEDLPIDIEISKKDIDEELDSEIEVSMRGTSLIDMEIEVPKFDEEEEIDSEIIISYIEELDSALEIEEISGGGDLDSELILRSMSEADLNSELIIENKYQSKDIDSVIIVKNNNYADLDINIELGNKNRTTSLDTELIIKSREFSDLNVEFEIEEINDYSDLDIEFNVRGTVDLDTEIEVPFIEDRDDIDIEMIVPYTDDLDVEFEIEEKEEDSNLPLSLTLTRKDLRKELDVEMVVRAFNASEIGMSLIIERRFELDCEMEVHISGGDYAFII